MSSVGIDTASSFAVLKGTSSGSEDGFGYVNEIGSNKLLGSQYSLCIRLLHMSTIVSEMMPHRDGQGELVKVNLNAMYRMLLWIDKLSCADSPDKRQRL
jgi:hypothetical protein